MITNDEFIAKLKNKHGDKYDYTKVVYNGRKKKICIICPEHGEFWQRADVHLCGLGCPKCGKKYKYTTDSFIKKAKEVHGDKYIYTKTQYKKSREKLCIICPKHGEFWKMPYEHLNGKGCPRCAIEEKNNNNAPSTEGFIKRAMEVHNNKYDYSKVSYSKAHSKVCIICPEHGEFWQTPNSHLKGCGCPKCGITKKLTNNEFIEKVRNIHADKYDYSKVEYKNMRIKVCIICPEHGEFWQTPLVHSQGYGCPKCKIEKFSSYYTLSSEDFVNKAIKTHGVKYNYSKVKYENAKKKVCIICPEHGEFWQMPNNHLSGDGCPSCSKSKLENKIKNFLIENRIKFVEEKTFEWLIYKDNMRLDFYLPEKNIAIECQGEQHFKPVDFSGKSSKEKTYKQFKIIKERDKRKKELCDIHNVDLLYYSDKNYGKNIFHNLNDLKNYIETCSKQSEK